MRLSFKEIDDGLKNEIFVNGTYIGTVTKDIWNGKWSLKPDFNLYGSREFLRKLKYDSFYSAGKAMAKLYGDTIIFFDEDEDTQEIDMRGVFTQRGPWGFKIWKN